MNIAEIRQKFPQYNDMSDDDLANALHSKFYSDMPRAEFNKRVGGDDIGYTKALTEGLRSGVTMNFGDELAGVAAASGMPGWARTAFPGAAFMAGAARAGYDALTGGGDARAAYEKRRDEVRTDQKAAQQHYPGTYLAGNVAAGVALPGGAMMNAATLPARMGRGAVAGGVFGGLSGAGEGETLPDRALRGAAGTAVGGVVGAVAPPLIEGAFHGARSLAAPVVNAFRGATNPEAEASRRVVTALERDARSDPGAATRLTPQEFANARAEGQPVTLMDLGGNLTRRLADNANVTSPEGGAALNRTINDRFEGQSNRLTGWLRSAFNYPDAHAQRAAIDMVERTVNRANYARAHMNPRANVMWDEGFEQLMQSPLMQNAAREATTTGANRSALQGFTPARRPFEFHDADSITPRYSLRTDANGQRVLPNLEFWDHVQRNLRDKIEVLRRQGANSQAADAGQLRGALLNRLDSLVPEFNAARTGAARFFGAEDALEAGQNFVGASQRFGIPEARAQLARMSQPERQLFQDGYVSRFVETIEKTGDRRNVLNQIAQSPAARQELEIVLGPQRWRELEVRLRLEGIMDLPRAAVQGNSWTARRLYDMGLAGGAGIGGLGGYEMDPTKMTAGAIVAALSSGGKHVNQNVARRVAELLVSNDPRRLQLGIQSIARSNNLLNALRSFNPVPRIGGQQGSGVMSGLQGPSRVAAEDEQQ